MPQRLVGSSRAATAEFYDREAGRRVHPRAFPPARQVTPHHQAIDNCGRDGATPVQAPNRSSTPWRSPLSVDAVRRRHLTADQALRRYLRASDRSTWSRIVCAVRPSRPGHRCLLMRLESGMEWRGVRSTNATTRKGGASQMGSLDGKVAFITGWRAAKARSHAVRLAEEGADIIGVDLCDQVPTVRYKMSTDADLEETEHLVARPDAGCSPQGGRTRPRCFERRGGRRCRAVRPARHDHSPTPAS